MRLSKVIGDAHFTMVKHITNHGLSAWIIWGGPDGRPWSVYGRASSWVRSDFFRHIWLPATTSTVYSFQIWLAEKLLYIYINEGLFISSEKSWNWRHVPGSHVWLSEARMSLFVSASAQCRQRNVQFLVMLMIKASGVQHDTKWSSQYIHHCVPSD